MEKDYIQILAVFPNMDCKKISVRSDSWDHFCDHHLNYPDPGNCFLPCKDENDQAMFLDMTKLLAFYILISEKSKKKSKKSKK